VLFAAVWWIGMGRLLHANAPALGWLTGITGMAVLLDAVGNIAGLPVVAEIGLNAYLLLGIVWPIAIGVALVRQKKAQHHIGTVDHPVAQKAEA
jgi:hypothetical protein